LGSSLYEEHIAFIAQKPPKESGVMAASAPPLSITSASPFCRWRNAVPSACDPAAHAEATP